MNQNIWILSDGKAGHLSQTRGLAMALIKRRGGQLREIDLAGKSFLDKLRMIWKQRSDSYAKATATMEVRDQPPPTRLPQPRGGDDTEEGAPDFIISAGHGTHLPLLLCGWLHKKAKTVVCMKPSFPMRWFDFCIVPRHDLSLEVLANPPAHIIPTIGALHGVQPSPESPKTHTLMLIGGPSKEYGWDEKSMLGQLRALVQAAVEGEEKHDVTHAVTQQKFLLTTSRRTPASFVQAVRNECPAIDVVPVEETPRGWISEKLSQAKAVWVTKDSVSMIYEALGSGAPVGLLNMIPHGGTTAEKSRVGKGIEMLEGDGWVTSFDIWKGTGILKSKGPLVEVGRVADMLVKLIS